jgi:hypothetical protein
MEHHGFALGPILDLGPIRWPPEILQGNYNELWIEPSEGTTELNGWRLEFFFRM